MQKAFSALLFVLAGACIALAVLALSNLFDDYKDSPDSTYIETAAFPLVLAALLLVAGILMLRKRPS
jgi:multisubunit Na+/H+ antiporter MnhG subunit